MLHAPEDGFVRDVLIGLLEIARGPLLILLLHHLQARGVKLRGAESFESRTNFKRPQRCKCRAASPLPQEVVEDSLGELATAIWSNMGPIFDHAMHKTFICCLVFFHSPGVRPSLNLTLASQLIANADCG